MNFVSLYTNISNVGVVATETSRIVIHDDVITRFINKFIIQKFKLHMVYPKKPIKRAFTHTNMQANIIHNLVMTPRSARKYIIVLVVYIIE